MKRHIFKLYYNYQKEEKWLNEMAADGWMMTHFFLGNYYFEEGQPGEYIYRLELLPGPANGLKNRQYLNFMEDSGVEVVCTWIRWVYYRRKASEGAFELFTDIESKLKHFRRVYILWAVLGFSQLCLLFTNLFNGIRMFEYSRFFTGYIVGLSIVQGLLITIFLSLAVSTYAQYRALQKEKQLHE